MSEPDVPGSPPCVGGVSAGAGGDDIVGVIGHRHGLRHPDAVADMHGADVGSQQDGLPVVLLALLGDERLDAGPAGC